MTTFAHLQIHSDYSVSEGLCRIGEIAKCCVEKQIFAAALTDVDNMFGWVKFSYALRQVGVKPIAGSDCQVMIDGVCVQVTLLCLNNEGYQQLIRLLSDAYLSDVRVANRVVCDFNALVQALGVVAIVHSDAYVKALANDDKAVLDQAFAVLEPMRKQRRLYAALSRVSKETEVVNARWAKQVTENKIPMVALNEVCFIQEQDFEAHEIRLCIDQGRVIQDQSRKKTHTNQQYFKSSDEMHQLFSDAKVVLENTNNLAKRCNVTLKVGEVFLPVVSEDNLPEYFANQVKEGLRARLSVYQSSRYTQQDYMDRVEREIKTINDMGFASYFLIVADFIQWSKNNGVPVGPGRGSGAGSLAAYSLKITDIDPLEYDLLFERFLNPERVSMPDFDIDFCMIGRDRVIEYVANKYGRLNVSQIITYGRMAAKAVVRDCGRVLGHPYGFVDKIAKLIPFDLGITLDKALAQEPMLAKRYQEETEVRQLIDFSRRLEGLVRNCGTHAGGVVIAPSKISDFSPIYRDRDHQNIVTQYDKDDIEKIGLVKFDFLGLRTLTIIDWALKNIEQSNGKKIDIMSISLSDKKTFKLLQNCLTTGVFQLESSGMKELIDRLVPDCFEDIVALVALYRPGPLQSGMVDDFVKRKHGLAEVVYQHPKLEPILNNTYGVILYQEQVMQIAQDMAGYSLGGADLLRRAMGKKKPEEMQKQREIFTSGALQANIDAKIAVDIFDLMEKFAGYGFNKSHSAAYALISYQTAWLKANYPTEFMAAVLSSDMDNTDKVIGFLEDVIKLGIEVLPPDINQSDAMFSVVKTGVIRYGLSAVKGIGMSAAQTLVKNRPRGGYEHLLSVCLEGEKVNKKLLESLVKSGACDCWGYNRATLLASIETALQTSCQQNSNQLLGQQDLLGSDIDFQYVLRQPMPKRLMLASEKETLGYYLSGHPVKECREELETLAVVPIGQVAIGQMTVKVAGCINKMKVIKTKKGGRIAFVELSDDTGKIDVAFFDETYSQYYELLSDDGVIMIEGGVSLDQFTQKPRIQCQSAYALEDYRLKRSPLIVITIKNPDETLVEKIVHLVKAHQGGSRLVMIYETQEGIAKFSIPQMVSLRDDMLFALMSIPGVQRYRLYYGKMGE